MTWLGAVFRLVGGNVVPGGGFLLAGWSPATALTLYWVDNLIGSIATAIRILLHRRWTGASGHDRGQLGATYSLGKNAPDRTFRSFFAEFAVTSLAFSLAQGVFLTFALSRMLETMPDRVQVEQGAGAILVAHLLALSVDTRQLASWRFAQLRDQAQRMLGRVVLVHLAVLGGMVFFAARGTPGAFFSVFVGLKFLADCGTLMPRYTPGDEPPRVLVWLMSAIPSQNGEPFTEYWKRTHAAERAQLAADEAPAAAVAEPTTPTVPDARPQGQPRRGKARRRRA